MYDKYVWNENSPVLFQEALSTHLVQSKISNFKDTQYDSVDGAVSDLNDIFLTAANSSLKKKATKKSKSCDKRKTHHQKWYDTDLKQLKKRLDHKCILFQKHSSDPIVRGSFFKCLKLYRKTTKYKAREFKNELIKKLEDLHDQNPKEYWKLVEQLQNSDSKHLADNDIDTDEWRDHFEKLNSYKPCSENCHNVLKSELEAFEASVVFNELDFRFTDQEIIKSIKLLKNSKASGPSMILNEMIKHGQCIFVPLFNKLFNLIFSNGKYPSLWSKGYISTIHKSGSKSDPSNYRGITICDNVGKLFNSVLNNRLSDYFEKHKLICKEQIGFMKGRRTADHMFVLNTLLNKYIKSQSKYIYACFVDFKKAFDSVWHLGLLYKLKLANVGTKFFTIIKSMYQQTEVCVKVGNFRTEYFKSIIGVRQGDNLSPNLFNLYINDLPNYFDQSCFPVSLNDCSLNCLMNADDVLLLSTSQDGLQKCVSKLEQFAHDWHMNINPQKTKVLVFNKAGRFKNISILYEGKPLECVQQYTYLGVTFSASGSYSKAHKGLQNKGVKALFKLRKSFNIDLPNASIMLHIFNHTVKPVLLYGSEIWGSFSVNKFKRDPEHFVDKEIDKLSMESVHTKFCKFTLGVRSNSSNWASRSELGSYPILYDVFLNIVKYWCHLVKQSAHSSILLASAMEASISLDNTNSDSWMGCPREIFNFLNLEYLFLHHEKWSYSYIISKVKKALKSKFELLWLKYMNNDNKINSQSGNKLRTYRKFKSMFSSERYLSLGTKKQRYMLSKFRISSHDLNIERGRYQKLQVKDRICQLCFNKIEDEIHFLLDCPSLEQTRSPIIHEIASLYPNFHSLTQENKFIWLLINEDDVILCRLLKLVELLFCKRKTILTV